MVQTANTSSNCDWDGYSEQLLTRTTEFSGLANAIFTVGYAFYVGDETDSSTGEAKSALYTAYDVLASGDAGCS